MPLTSEISESFLVITARGPWRFADLAALLRSRAEDAPDGGFGGILMDDRGSVFDPPVDEFYSFGRSFTPETWCFGTRVAIVVDTDHKLGLANMASALALSDVAIQVFGDLDAAWEWLHRDDPMPDVAPGGRHPLM